MNRKKRKIPTPESLANAALQYLTRYAASEESFRRVLKNRIRRAALDNPDFGADLERQGVLLCEIERLLEKHRKSGALNDDSFAETKVRSLRREGRSRRYIAQKLAVKGLSSKTVEAALLQNAEGATADEAEFAAALALAKRRKIGPFRKGLTDRELKRKEFALLARAGFSFDTAQKVLGSGPDFFEF